MHFSVYTLTALAAITTQVNALADQLRNGVVQLSSNTPNATSTKASSDLPVIDLSWIQGAGFCYVDQKKRAPRQSDCKNLVKKLTKYPKLLKSHNDNSTAYYYNTCSLRLESVPANGYNGSEPSNIDLAQYTYAINSTWLGHYGEFLNSQCESSKDERFLGGGFARVLYDNPFTGASYFVIMEKMTDKLLDKVGGYNMAFRKAVYSPPAATVRKSSKRLEERSVAEAGSFAVVGMIGIHLYPAGNDNSFVPKQIGLSLQRVKIGRQTNAKTVPASNNAYFDSKVLSRMHAEVWIEPSNKVYIKDVKSSNGTFINGDRLSPEGIESDEYELHTNDLVEFGIDIVADDNKTIVHHKVAAKIYLVLTPDDALNASRHFASYYRDLSDSSVLRRNQSKPMLGYDQMMSHLQNALSTTRQTGKELGDLNSTIKDIQDTLGGNPTPPSIPVPPSLYSAQYGPRQPPSISNVRPYGAPSSPPSQQDSTLALLQNQLAETQNALAANMAKIASLEALFREHEGFKKEIGEMRSLVEWNRKEMRALVRAGVSPPSGPFKEPIPVNGDLPNGTHPPAHEDDDDTASIASVETIKEDQPAVEPPAKLTNGHTASPPPPPDTSRLESLESRINELETRLNSPPEHPPANPSEDSLLTTEWATWKSAFENSFAIEKAAWTEEKDKLAKIVQEWSSSRPTTESSSSSESSSRRKRSSRRRRRPSKSPSPPEIDEFPPLSSTNTSTEEKPAPSTPARSRSESKEISEPSSPESPNTQRYQDSKTITTKNWSTLAGRSGRDPHTLNDRKSPAFDAAALPPGYLGAAVGAMVLGIGLWAWVQHKD